MNLTLRFQMPGAAEPCITHFDTEFAKTGLDAWLAPSGDGLLTRFPRPVYYAQPSVDRQPGHPGLISLITGLNSLINSRWVEGKHEIFPDSLTTSFVMVNGTLALDDESPTYILAGTTIRNQEAPGVGRDAPGVDGWIPFGRC